jgi:hypothetical protein
MRLENKISNKFSLQSYDWQIFLFTNSSNGVDELIQVDRGDGDKPVDGCSIGNVTNEYIGKLENVLTIVSIIIIVY